MSRAKRAKKSKLPKKILLIILLLSAIIIGIMNFRPEIEKSVASIIGGNVESYDANDYLKDVFTETNGTNKTLYLPIVYSDTYEQVTKSDIQAKFAAAGIKIDSIPETIVNGSQIKTPNATYTVIIYGDVNSDGKVNVRDAQRIVQHLLYEGNSKYTLTGISRTAANVFEERQNVLDVRDAQRIIQFIIGKNKIIDTIPASDISKDKEPPVITYINPGEDSEGTLHIELNGEFEDLIGATVTDNLDPNVKLIIDSSRVDTSKAGTYYITYTAVDASNNKTVRERKVIVENRYAPEIVFNDLGLDGEGYLAVNVGDKAAYDALDLSATVIDKKDGIITEELMPSSNPVDIDVPNRYTLTYKIKNSQNVETTVTRIVEVVDHVKSIVITGALTETIYNEDDEIDLSGLTATITKESNKVETVSLDKFGKGEYESYEIVYNAPFENGKANYDESNDSLNASRNISINIKYTNPADNRKAESGMTSIGAIKVLGHIREFVDNQIIISPINGLYKTEGIMYQEIPIANIMAKENQQKLTNSNLKVKVNTVDGYKPTVTKTITNGIANVEFRAEKTGIYKVTIEASTDSNYKVTREIEVKVTQSEIVNNIKVTQYEGILKAGGTYKDIGLVFEHEYTINNAGGKLSLPIDLTADRLNILFNNVENDNEIKYTFLTTNSDNEYEEIVAGDTESPVTGIRLRADENTVIPSGTDDTNRFSEKSVLIYVDRGNTDAECSRIVQTAKIYPKSKFTVSLEIPAHPVNEKDITIYMQEKGKKAQDIVVSEDGYIYTLIKAEKVDQYLSDQATQPITLGELSNRQADKDSNHIAFIDSANASEGTSGRSYIAIAGFNKSTDTASGYAKVKTASSNIEYVGIALGEVTDLVTAQPMGDEDERFLNSGAIISVYHNIDDNTNPVAVKTLTVDIAKKDVTKLTYEMEKTYDYCYGKDKDDLIVARITSGLKEKDIKLGNLRYNIYYSETADGTFNKITSGYKYNELTGDNGYVEIEFYAINKGYYKIEATLNNMPGQTVGNIAPIMTDVIHITENPIVTRVEFEKYDMDDPFNRDKTTVIPPQNAANSYFGTVRDNKSETHRIVYYHDYTDTDSRVIPSEYIPAVEGIIIENKPTYLNIVPSTVNGRELSEDNQVGAGKVKCEYLNILINKDNHNNYGETKFDLIVEQNIAGEKVVSDTLTIDLTIATQASIKKIELYDANSDSWTDADKATEANMFYAGATESETQGYDVYKKGNVIYSVFKVTYRDSDGDRVPIKYNDVTQFTALLGDKTIWVSSDKEQFPGSGYGGIGFVTLNESNGSQPWSEATTGTATHIGISLENITIQPTQIWVLIGQDQTSGAKLPINFKGTARTIIVPKEAYEEAKKIGTGNITGVTSDDDNDKSDNNILDNKVNSVNNLVTNNITTSNNVINESKNPDISNNSVVSDEPLDTPVVPEENDDNTKQDESSFVEDNSEKDTLNNDEQDDVDKSEDIQ